MKWEYHVLTGEGALPRAALDQLGWEGWELAGVTSHAEERALDGAERALITVYVCLFKRPVVDPGPGG